MVLDEPTGAYVNVTTCQRCKDANEVAGLIVDPDNIPLDDFVNPFADDTIAEGFKVFNADGTVTTITTDLTDSTE